MPHEKGIGHIPNCVRRTRGDEVDLLRPAGLVDLVTGPVSVGVEAARRALPAVIDVVDNNARKIYHAGQLALMTMFPR
jgi:hypothetical protein